MNAYPNLSGHCPHKYGIISLMEKESRKEESIAGKNPYRLLITKNKDTNIAVANIALVR